jgi:LuxR family maltose regulon positive regulatory protein
MAAYPFPITGAKVHPPLLRADTLSRPRLNDWLDRAATGRVVLIIAEAGFGKTTLLADWASRSSRRTAWYRLEPDDRDWLVFLRHLVAAGREIDADFGAETLELILGLGAGGPSQADVVASIVREYGDFAARLSEGLTLIVDDQHLIDGSAETDRILRALIDRTGGGFSIVIASRSAPRLPVGGLRTRGGLSRLDGADLRFDVPETDRLFREAYRRPLDPDVVDQLIGRTEGWAALLMLVRTSLEDKAAPEARALVAQLSAARGDLYDFLAEEVLASLSPALTHFITRVSVLVSVDAETGSLVVDRPVAEVAGLIAEAEALGLLSRPDREAPHRFHPLVRDFLAAHLVAEVGEEAIRDLHLRVAHALEPTDWFGSAWHYRAGGQPEDAARVIDAALPNILAMGTVELTNEFLDGSAGRSDRPEALVLRSRLELSRDNAARARELAEAAATAAVGGANEAPALLNLARIRSLWGFDEESLQFASEARKLTTNPTQTSIADAFVLLGDLTKTGNLNDGADALRELAARQERDGLLWYRAVTLLNQALALEWAGQLPEALEVATTAESEMARLGSKGVERAAALVGRANILAKLGRSAESHRLAVQAFDLPTTVARSEAAFEACRLYTAFGDLADAQSALAIAELAPSHMNVGLVQLARGEIALRMRDLTAAQEASKELDGQPCADIAGLMRSRLLRARVGLATGDANSLAQATEALRIAEAQGSQPGIQAARALAALADDQGPVTLRVDPSNIYVLSMIAESLTTVSQRLSADTWQLVADEAYRRPSRWREPLLFDARAAGSERCAELVSTIGDEDTALRLRSLAADNKAFRPSAIRITHRLARQVQVVDLGHVELFLGSDRLKVVRRKVLGLLCFLGSRPTMAGTRDEVLEALWSELKPDTAANSLHQTIYFLRRAFEPDYREGLSAGYVTYDGEVVSLSEELCDILSRRCWRSIRRIPTDLGALDELLDLYRGKFALDFAYEDWADDYRGNLHAAVLAAAEAGMARHLNEGDHDSVIRIGHRVLAVDPDADGIELMLLRAYKQGGRHAAAAEQYAHYAAYIRELGADPPAYDEI